MSSSVLAAFKKRKRANSDAASNGSAPEVEVKNQDVNALSTLKTILQGLPTPISVKGSGKALLIRAHPDSDTIRHFENDKKSHNAHLCYPKVKLTKEQTETLHSAHLGFYGVCDVSAAKVIPGNYYDSNVESPTLCVSKSNYVDTRNSNWDLAEHAFQASERIPTLSKDEIGYRGLRLSVKALRANTHCAFGFSKFTNLAHAAGTAASQRAFVPRSNGIPTKYTVLRKERVGDSFPVIGTHAERLGQHKTYNDNLVLMINPPNQDGVCSEYHGAFVKSIFKDASAFETSGHAKVPFVITFELSFSMSGEPERRTFKAKVWRSLLVAAFGISPDPSNECDFQNLLQCALTDRETPTQFLVYLKGCGFENSFAKPGEPELIVDGIHVFRKVEDYVSIQSQKLSELLSATLCDSSLNSFTTSATHILKSMDVVPACTKKIATDETMVVSTAAAKDMIQSAVDEYFETNSVSAEFDNKELEMVHECYKAVKTFLDSEGVEQTFTLLVDSLSKLPSYMTPLSMSYKKLAANCLSLISDSAPPPSESTATSVPAPVMEEEELDDPFTDEPLAIGASNEEASASADAEPVAEEDVKPFDIEFAQSSVPILTVFFHTIEQKCESDEGVEYLKALCFMVSKTANPFLRAAADA